MPSHNEMVRAVRIALCVAAILIGAQAAPLRGQTTGGPAEVVTTLAFTEAPAQAPDGTLYFTDLPSQRIMRVGRDGLQSTYRTNSNVANGLLFDGEGRLLACEGGSVVRPGINLTGRPRVTRTDMATGRVEVLVESGQGVTLVGPNDLTMDSRGTVYFTDFPGSGVYRIDGPGKVTQLLNPKTVNRPNGIQISPDDSTLYLVETGVGDEPRRMVRSYRIRPDGSLERQRIHHGFFTADGMSIDVQGNLYVSGGKEHAFPGAPMRVGIFVVAPDGSERGFYPLPVNFTTNNGFGGPDMKTLYIAGGDMIFRVRTDVAGLPR
nr:Gluconolactonase [uncultured bacterium]